ncbi:MAG: SpoIID/LytB domain-containing protein [Elusimicrobia bacterium]|nr:SpoIID/LytB domain-containing protein [Candidatus Liberimonas magnetica]
MIYKLVVLFYFFNFLAVNAYSKQFPATTVKIGILQDQKSFNVSCEGDYYASELKSGKREDVKSSDIYLVRGQGAKIRFNGFSFESPVRLMAKNPKDRVTIDGKHYRDSLLILCKDGRLSLVNELGLEDYIYGILPREVSPEWPLESLKAQAVISRTYALQNIGKHEKDDFDLCNTVHCQVYGGVESEDSRSNKAVEETRGEVIIFKDKLAHVFFHAACGGHTEDPNEVWNYGEEVPKYLMGHTCRFCKNSPHNNWKNELSAEYIRKKLNTAGYDVGEIKRISGAGRTGSGRVRNLKVTGEKKSVAINAAKFRLFVDTYLIKSTYIDSIKKKGTKFVFAGSGWGHGVGMCQWGTKKMAEKGYDYKQILKYYFPKTSIEKWK